MDDTSRGALRIGILLALAAAVGCTVLYLQGRAVGGPDRQGADFVDRGPNDSAWASLDELTRPHWRNFLGIVCGSDSLGALCQRTVVPDDHLGQILAWQASQGGERVRPDLTRIWALALGQEWDLPLASHLQGGTTVGDALRIWNHLADSLQRPGERSGPSGGSGWGQ